MVGPDFLTGLLEKGGLPALSLGICFLIFMKFLKSQSRRDIAAQKEREAARKRESKQYDELMHAFAEMVKDSILSSKQTAEALTRLSERVGQCPLKNIPVHTLMEGKIDE